VKSTVKLEHLLKEMFETIDGWLTPDQVHIYHIQRAHGPISQLDQPSLIRF
jgi:hypothetical protein